MKIEIDNIDVSDKITDFTQYLQTTDRIILSAKFGDGKTFLLNELRSNLKEEYEFFTIYPINYSVAKNEDVFEYIKRDIIIQLQERGFLDNIDMEALFDSIFCFEDLVSVVSFLLSFVPMGEFYNRIFNKFCEKKKLYKEKKHTSDKYLAEFANTKGSIYEEDGYTKLIRNAIEWISYDHATNGADWKRKKPVLIIEDLDRLDPKHLFRILNVISAHIDNPSSPDKVGNKFGFHNIVLVMDYDTTKHIFQHFYGEEACYEGYMSKFLSREPFRYSILPYMVKEIKSKLAESLEIPNHLPTYTNFMAKLHKASLRDLKKIATFDTFDRLQSDTFSFKQFHFATSLPIFQLIIYMVECGMSINQITQDLQFTTRRYENIREKDEYEREYVKLMFPLYKMAYEDKRSIQIDDTNYRIEGDFSEVISKIDVHVYDYVDRDAMELLRDTNFVNHFQFLLDKLSKCINLSALHK